MEGLLWGIIFLLLLWAGVLSARLCCYKKQMSHMLKELRILESEETNLLLTCAVKIGQTPEVVSAVNRVLEKSRKRQERMIRENRIYRESITGISHDIRTPLTSARGYIQMLRGENDFYGRNKGEDHGSPGRDNGPSERADAGRRLLWAQIVERRLNDLSVLLDQLFLYARIEAGEISLSMEEANVSNLFAETISLFYEDFLEKGCEPEIFIEPEPCHIRTDKQAFVRITENLIRNALVHGAGDYKISLKGQEDSVTMRVSNAAGGIETGELERIFDRFYTADTSTGRKSTGLGLAIVKELAQRMGGEVRAGLEAGIFSVEVRFLR